MDDDCRWLVVIIGSRSGHKSTARSSDLGFSIYVEASRMLALVVNLKQSGHGDIKIFLVFQRKWF